MAGGGISTNGVQIYVLRKERLSFDDHITISSVDHVLLQPLSLSLSLSLQTVPISSVAVRRRSEEAHLVFCGGRGRERAGGRTRGRTDHAIVAIVARVWITRHKIAPSLRAGLLVF